MKISYQVGSESFSFHSVNLISKKELDTRLKNNSGIRTIVENENQIKINILYSDLTLYISEISGMISCITIYDSNNNYIGSLSQDFDTNNITLWVKNGLDKQTIIDIFLS